MLLWSCNSSNTDNKTKTDNTAAGTTTKMAAASTTTPSPKDSAAMMKAWMDFATPGAMYTDGKKPTATREAKVSQWMDAKVPPTKIKAINIQTAAIGGRYVLGKFSITMMGQPFEGMSTMGYDNGKKMFVSTWLDTMGTGIIYMTGTYDEAN